MEYLWMACFFSHNYKGHARSVTLGFERRTQPCLLPVQPKPTETQLSPAPGSPLSNKHPTKHIWWGKTQTASLKPISWCGCKKKPWGCHGCNDGGEEPNTHNLMSQLKQPITFVHNAKAGKSPFWRAQQLAQFALLLGSISRKLPTRTFIVALHATSSCTQVLYVGDVSCKWGRSASPSMSKAASPLERPTRKVLKEGEKLPTEHSSAVLLCARANTISSWPQQSNLFMPRNKRLDFPYLSLKLQSFY